MAFRRSKNAERATTRKDGATASRAGSTSSGRYTPKQSGRYTPPTPKEFKVSPRWVPILMLTLLVAGMLVIVCNYLGVLPRVFFVKKSPDNAWLFIGLGLITGGFITATNYR